jgi:hypothetical protein
MNRLFKRTVNSIAAVLMVMAMISSALFSAAVPAMAAGAVTVTDTTTGAAPSYYNTLYDAISALNSNASGDAFSVSVATDLNETQQISVMVPNVTITSADPSTPATITFTLSNTTNPTVYGCLVLNGGGDIITGINLTATGSSPLDPAIVWITSDNNQISNCTLTYSVGDTNVVNTGYAIVAGGGSNGIGGPITTGSLINDNIFTSTDAVGAIILNNSSSGIISGNAFTGAYVKRALTVDTATDALSVTGNNFNSTSAWTPSQQCQVLYYSATDPGVTGVINLTGNTFTGTNGYPVVIYDSSPWTSSPANPDVTPGSNGGITGNAFLNYPTVTIPNSGGSTGIVGIYDQNAQLSISDSSSQVNNFLSSNLYSGGYGYFYGLAYPVTGKVTQDGSSLSDVPVTFTSNDGTVTSTVYTAADGTYTLPLAAGVSGTVTVPAAQAGYEVTTPDTNPTISTLSAAISNCDFAYTTIPNYTVSGTVYGLPDYSVLRATYSLDGGTTTTPIVVNSDGTYSFTVPSGSIVTIATLASVTVSGATYSANYASITTAAQVTADLPGQDFTYSTGSLTNYTVTYTNTGADSGTPPTDSTAYQSGQSAPIAGAGTLVKAGYTLTGWTDGTTTYAIGASIPVTGNVTLNPVWTPNLKVTKTTPSTRVSVGGNVVYTITVMNNTNANATNLSVVESMYGGTWGTPTLIPAAGSTSPTSPAITSSATSTASASNLTVSSAVYSGEGFTVTYTVPVKAASAGKTLTNTVNVNDTQRDSATATNSQVSVNLIGGSGGGGGGGGSSAVSTTATTTTTTTPTTTTTTNPTVALNTTDRFAYVIGYPNGTVKPGGNMTRAEVATIFFRLLTDSSRAANWSTTNSYTDVSKNLWYNNAISTLTKAGIVSGFPGGQFRPNAKITRAQLATMAARFANATPTKSVTFKDVNGSWAASDIYRAAGLGWLTGYSNGTFLPNQLVTRAEVMVVVNRVLGRSVTSASDLLSGMATWSDNSNVNAWYYLDVQEATNSYDYQMNAAGNGDKWTAIIANPDWKALEQQGLQSPPAVTSSTSTSTSTN